MLLMTLDLLDAAKYFTGHQWARLYRSLENAQTLCDEPDAVVVDTVAHVLNS